MNHSDQSNDPYAPPPRYKDRSGRVLRVVLLAGLLGLVGWGYLAFNDGPSLSAQVSEEQQMADSSLDIAPPEPAPLSEPAINATPDVKLTPSAPCVSLAKTLIVTGAFSVAWVAASSRAVGASSTIVITNGALAASPSTSVTVTVNVWLVALPVVLSVRVKV